MSRSAWIAGVAAMAVAIGAPAWAQQASAARSADSLTERGARPATPRHAAAQAAGFRALHVCTGLFSSGMSRELVERTAFDRSGSSASLKTEIDETGRRVLVHFADDMPPRVAVWRPNLGCAQLPIGADPAAGGELLRAWPQALTAPDFSDKPWPQGDRNAEGRLSAKRRAALEAVLDSAFAGQSGAYSGRTWGVVVIQDGRIVGERYAPGFGPTVAARTNSMCKSLGATLVGVGVKQGLLDLHRRPALSEWGRPGDPRGQITLDHLLHMASGLYTEGGGNPQAELYQSGAAAAEVSALNMVDARPGERFVYAGSDTILAVRALRQAVTDDAAFISYPHRELLWKIGMTRTVIETDWNDDFLVSGQCWSTARDFGRFGMLYLADGVWSGERILPEGWSRYVSTPAPAQPTHADGEGPAYGAQFWLYGGQEGLPEVAYSPGGALGQYAMINPSRKVVVVRRGLDIGGSFRMAKFSADVLVALGQ